MRTIAHISDLHFGREDPEVVRALTADLQERKPSLIAVSGDVTQRARRRQFEAARSFLDGLAAPVLVVPGNHDIPLFHLLGRALYPLRNYTTFLSPEPEPFFHVEDLAVVGVNTARRGLWKDGRVSEAQIARMRDLLSPLPPRVFKVVVTHHPFLPAPGDPAPALVGGGHEALAAAESCGVDLLLAGHLHVAFTGDVRPHYTSVRRSMIVAQAGTATSVRLRDEPNAYNWIVVDPPRLVLEVRSFEKGAFTPRAVTGYVQRDGQWDREA